MFVSLESVVGVATGYGVEGLGIESRWGRGFLYPFRLTLTPTQPLLQWVSVFFLRGKTTGLWRWPFFPVKHEGKSIYLLLSGPSWTVFGSNLPLNMPTFSLHFCTYRQKFTVLNVYHRLHKLPGTGLTSILSRQNGYLTFWRRILFFKF